MVRTVLFTVKTGAERCAGSAVNGFTDVDAVQIVGKTFDGLINVLAHLKRRAGVNIITDPDGSHRTVIFAAGGCDADFIVKNIIKIIGIVLIHIFRDKSELNKIVFQMYGSLGGAPFVTV